jgi:hypothetical protein
MYFVIRMTRVEYSEPWLRQVTDLLQYKRPAIVGQEGFIFYRDIKRPGKFYRAKLLEIKGDWGKICYKSESWNEHEVLMLEFLGESIIRLALLDELVFRC